ncbi:FIG00031715: Predicted metal-dependent phosphoesterases (PHP family) [hydrothermal vent metagenome]|uniref:FIG00031715: Predicted metal-dependent phosphoesterases (PHP family) n=1 Tax=hydrothermal vent metagenome TaxID=652676 RepID=A0A3B1CP04_9ZZZZ
MVMTRFADLHLHTTRSDGYFSPSELVSKGARLGFSTLAITDHDTVGGIEEASREATRHEIELIPGIEISTNYGGKSVHILGYMINIQNAVLLKTLSGIIDKRIERLENMVHRLADLGYPLDISDVFSFIGNRVPGRALLARYLVKAGYYKSVGEVFENILGDSGEVYEPVSVLNPENAIEIINGAGGISSIAHPGNTRVDEIFPRLVEAGLDGVEAYNPIHTKPVVSHYLKIAQKYDLLVTGGSDYHGPQCPARNIGQIKLDYTHVERIKERAACFEVFGW